MSQSQKKVILITGASSGIGESVAREAAKDGHIVILGARRQKLLEGITKEISEAGGIARCHCLDVTVSADFEKAVRATLDEFGQLDVLVNNAGIMPLSPLRALKTTQWHAMVDVNIKGVLNGIAAVLPLMDKRGEGHIINVASIGAHLVFPTAAVYCATKYAVWAISDGLRQESDRLRVTVISPGVVRSELANTITDETAKAAMGEFRRIALEPKAIGRAVLYTINQPADVDVNEIIVRPTATAH